MNIAKLFHELVVISDVEIVVALLPEVSASPIDRRDTPCFNHLSASASNLRSGSGLSRWTWLRHDHLPIDAETEADSDALQSGLKSLPVFVRREHWTAMMATERLEGALSGFLNRFKPKARGKFTPDYLPTQAKTRLERATRQIVIRRWCPEGDLNPHGLAACGF